MRARTALRALGICTALAGAVAACARQPATVDVQILAFNDFHGRLDPPSGATGKMGDVAAGGIEYFATHLARLKATNPNTIVVSAGDNVGATPFLSGLFHDEPTIESLNSVGLEVSAVGNHELDEGWWELLRLQKGGCHPTDGCQDNTPFEGARFKFLAANVILDPAVADPQALAMSGWHSEDNRPAPLLPPTLIKEIGGVKVGFIGITLRRAAAIVRHSAMRGLTIGSELDAANQAADALSAAGVHAIVLLIHEGGDPSTENYDGCNNLTGEILPIRARLTKDIDVVVSGHTHRAYVCTDGPTLLTSAESYGRLITDIDLTIDRQTGEVVAKRATNVVVTRDVEKNAAASAILDRYRPFATELGSREVGRLTLSIAQQPNRAGESPLGDLVADAMLEGSSDPEGGSAVVALVNPGGIRTDLTRKADGSPVTYADAFEVVPFSNVIVVQSLSGDALLRLLEEQFDNPTTGESRVLQVSKGFSYSYDFSQPPGRRVRRGSVRINGRGLESSVTYRVAMSDFLWAGGDGFTVVREGTDPINVGNDVDLFVAYLRKHSPLTPGTPNRVRREDR